MLIVLLPLRYSDLKYMKINSCMHAHNGNILCVYVVV